LIPDNRGYFGDYGGRFVPETLIPALDELVTAYTEAKTDASFMSEFNLLCHEYAGRPTAFYFAEQLTNSLEELRFISNVRTWRIRVLTRSIMRWGRDCLRNGWAKKGLLPKPGQGNTELLWQRSAPTLGLKCVIYMGSDDIQRQALNVSRMKLMGAEVVPVTTGSRTLKDAINEAIRDWVTNVETTYYIIGSVVGPHPYPMMVRDFQSVIGMETKAQMMGKCGRLPDYIVACVGGGSNSVGMFHPFIDDKNVRLIGVEAAGKGIETEKHAAALITGTIGVLHGAKSYLLQDQNGQIKDTYSISAGLDYPVLARNTVISKI